MASICIFFSCANFSYLVWKLEFVRLEGIPHRHLFDKATCKRVFYPRLRGTIAVRSEEQPKIHEEIFVISTIVLPGYFGVYVACL